MKNYNDFLRNISKLIEKGVFSSKDVKKELEKAILFKIENITNRLNLVSREEFEIQKKLLEKLRKDLNKLKKKKKSKKE